MRHTGSQRTARRSGPSPLFLLGSALATAYFVHHAINGKHGLEARGRMVERSSMLERQIAALETSRRHLARDIALLRPELPASDIVEEIAIDVLGWGRPDDRWLPAPIEVSKAASAKSTR